MYTITNFCKIHFVIGRDRDVNTFNAIKVECMHMHTIYVCGQPFIFNI